MSVFDENWRYDPANAEVVHVSNVGHRRQSVAVLGERHTSESGSWISSDDEDDARGHLASAAPWLYRWLKDLEWSAWRGDIQCCPSCDARARTDLDRVDEGIHLIGCKLAGALRKAEGVSY